MILEVSGVEFGAKIEQKLMLKSSSRKNASVIQFLNIFDGFLVLSWQGKAIKNRYDAKKKRTKEGQKRP